MKKALLLVLLLACQKHDDSTSTNVSASATATATASTSTTPAPSEVVSVRPLATIEPSAAASAAPVVHDGGLAASDKRAALNKQADDMQMQMLKAFGGGSPDNGVLNARDIPPIDLSQLAAPPRDAGGGGGAVRPGVRARP